jgi:hypothetical protein
MSAEHEDNLSEVERKRLENRKRPAKRRTVERCVYQMRVSPSFDAEYRWDILIERSPDGERAFAIRRTWDTDGSIHRMPPLTNAPAGELGRTSRMPPTRVDVVDLPREWPDRAVQELSEIRIAPWGEQKYSMLDGVRYELVVYGRSWWARYDWGIAPDEWAPLTAWFHKTLRYLEGLPASSRAEDA